jgi:hypothetical protein
MRKFFVFMMLMVFVGGHGLSDRTHASHRFMESTVAQATLLSPHKILAKVSALVGKTDHVGETHFSIDKSTSSFGSLHCSIYCGLMAAQFVSVYPDSKSDLNVQYLLLNSSITINEHFRPPIV